MSRSPSAGQQLREVLEAVADNVPAAYDSYHSALGGWRRRERRRRLVLAVLILVVFVVAVAAGLWVLNRSAPSGHTVIYSVALAPAAGGPAAG
ncbi:hypothetical protein [Streptomyces sp. JJ36]|uniref:hypothetical protein n=1 Tax=Streptomyces sp. JJ36 TaxID=2736645 RepID=UPI001F1F57F8|nr:hypothetical protein [Streptomyces sp. JJ36]MCF6521805.1 hypothetical protein [Streptomyces sp. JJ36]